MNPPKKSNPFFLIAVMFLWIGLCYAVAWTGAQVSPGIASADWYNSLTKPSWNPPNWLFGPVWTVLYTLMGISAWLVWKDHGFRGARIALGLFLIQLFLNGLWSQIFFGMQAPGWAFFQIFFLLAAILATTYLFFQKNRVSGLLMVPYLAWTCFAAALNGAIWALNN